MSEERLIGKITHYYSNINVGVLELSDSLKVGDKIRIRGKATDFEQEVESMQVEHQPVSSATAGDAVGLKIKDRVKEGDEVYLLSE